MKKIIVNCETGNSEEVDDPEWTEVSAVEEPPVIQDDKILSHIVELQKKITELTLLQNKMHFALVAAVNNDINIPVPSFDDGKPKSGEGYISVDFAQEVFQKEVDAANKSNKERINEILRTALE